MRNRCTDFFTRTVSSAAKLVRRKFDGLDRPKELMEKEDTTTCKHGAAVGAKMAKAASLILDDYYIRIKNCQLPDVKSTLRVA